MSSSKHGRLNFNFAADKFKVQKNEIKNFSIYLNEKHINFRRNKNIAHKEMSPTWKQIDPKPAYQEACFVTCNSMDNFNYEAI